MTLNLDDDKQLNLIERLFISGMTACVVGLVLYIFSAIIAFADTGIALHEDPISYCFLLAYTLVLWYTIYKLFFKGHKCKF